MLAVIDIGNTNVVFGLYDGPDLATHFRFATRHSATSDEYACLLDGLFRMSGMSFDRIDGACIASVVPPLTEVFATLVQQWFRTRPVVVGADGVRTGISVLCEVPVEVGADRIVNAVAAHARYATSLVIVDFGTATTFDAVTAAGEYLGGAIVPGVRVSLDALFQRTAKLPKVELARPDRVIGRTTVRSIQSGAYWGYLSMVEGLVQRMKAELAPPVTVVATGGLAGLLCEGSPAIDVVDGNLTLEGLMRIWQMNR